MNHQGSAIKKNREEETLGGDGYIYYLDCDGANVTVHKGLNNSSNCMG